MKVLDNGKKDDEIFYETAKTTMKRTIGIIRNVQYTASKEKKLEYLPWLDDTEKAACLYLDQDSSKNAMQ
jgi:hypothetical protein